MLVVDSAVPGSLAEGLLEPGDIVTKVQGRVVTHFLALEDILDSAVGEAVSLDLERGGKAFQANVKVPYVLKLHVFQLEAAVSGARCRTAYCTLEAKSVVLNQSQHPSLPASALWTCTSKSLAQALISCDAHI